MRLLKPGWVHHDDKPIFSVDIHQDCTKFATGGQGIDSGRVVIWNLKPVLSEKDENDASVPKMLCQMDQHLACVNCVRWSQNGLLLASGSDDKLIMIWRKSQGASGVFGTGGMQKNHESWKCFHTLRGHAGDVLDLAWSPNDIYLASCSIDNTVIIWDARSFPMMVTTLRGHTGLVKGVTWDPVGRYLASQSDDRSVKIWSTMDWTCSNTVTEPFEECGGTTHILRLSWSPDGQYLVSAHAMNGGGPTAQIIEREGWKCDKDFVGHRKAVTCVRFHNSILKRAASAASGSDAGGSGKPTQYCCLAVGSRDRSLSVWLTALQRPMIVIHELFNDSILDLSWGPKERLLMACSGDGSIACLQFADDELGTSLSEDDKNSIFQRLYGKSIGNGLGMPESGFNILVENPELASQALDGKAGETSKITPPMLMPELEGSVSFARPSLDRLPSASQSPMQQKPISKQTETRTKDGKRRITPMFIPLNEQDDFYQTTTNSAATSSSILTSSSSSVSSSATATASKSSDAVATPAAASDDPVLSKNVDYRFDPRLKMLQPGLRRQPIPFDIAELEGFPRSLGLNQNVPPANKDGDQASSLAPKLTITPTSKCEFIKQTLQHRIHVSNGHLKTSQGMLAKVTAGSIDPVGILWEFYVGSPVVNVNLCKKYCMLCSLDGSMRLLSIQTGCPVFPAISLSSSAIHCTFSPDNELVGVLTECGILRIWNIVKRNVHMAASCQDLLDKHGTAVNFIITDKGMPLIAFPNCNSYSYSVNLQSWLVLATRDPIMYNGIRGTLPRQMDGVSQKFPLLSMQANSQNYYSLRSSQETNTECWQQPAKFIFIENQIKLCEALESLDEFKHWHMMMVFQLATYGSEHHLRLFLDDLLNNPEPGIPQFVPKTELMQCALDTLKPHVQWQRLYAEYVELFKFCRSQRNEDIFATPAQPAHTPAATATTETATPQSPPATVVSADPADKLNMEIAATSACIEQLFTNPSFRTELAEAISSESSTAAAATTSASTKSAATTITGTAETEKILN
ncbi:protein HIRA homolog [Drosophila tropicalis]|uniref:protein HIRA homolog n=1 Tax=Drosophila tropicalis TaxID=46794 RepID=UPI0035ABF1E4